MNPDLESKLYSDYPEIFKEHSLSIQQSCMPWGCQCGDGWEQIIRGFCLAVNHPYRTWVDVGEEVLEHDCPQVVVTSLKEKYGVCLIYFRLEHTAALQAIADKSPEIAAQIMHDFHQYVDGVATMAECLSSITCEVTGRPGQLMSTGGSPMGWLRVLCPDEAARQGYAPIRKGEEET